MRSRSVSLVGEADRKMLKAAIKHSGGGSEVRHRIVPPEAVAKWTEKLGSLKDEISQILQEEREEKQVRYSRQCLQSIILRTNSYGKQRWNSRRVKI